MKKRVGETDEQFIERVRQLALEKLRKTQKPLDPEALKAAQELSEESHLGDLSQGQKGGGKS